MNLSAVDRPIGTDMARMRAYRTGYQRLRRIVRIEMAVTGLLLLALLVTFWTLRAEDRFHALTSEGTVIALDGMTRPPVNQQVLFDWAANAASQIMTFGFNDYDAKLSAARDRFTDDGWLSFAQVLSQSVFFRNIVAEQQISTAVPQAPPTMFFEGVDVGQYVWIIEVPLMVTVRSGSRSRSFSQTVRLVITPVSTHINPMGIAIDRWISF